MTNAFGRPFGAGATLAAQSLLAHNNFQAQVPRAPAVHPPGAPAPQTPGVPPRQSAQFIPDAQYLAEAAQRQFERQTRLDELKAEGEAQRTATQEAMRQLMQGAPEQRQQINQGAARQGLFYSGILGKRQGDFESQLVRQRANVQGQFDTQQRAREAARAAILRGAPLDEAAAKAAAVERQIQRDTQAASNNQLAPTPPPKATAKPKPKPTAKPRRRPKPKPRAGNVHVGSGSTHRRRKKR